MPGKKVFAEKIAMLESSSGNENQRMNGRNLPNLPGFFASTSRPATRSARASQNRISKNIVPIAAADRPTTFV